MTSTVARQADSRDRVPFAPSGSWLPHLAVGALLAYLAPRVLVGSDTLWMVALGERVATGHAVPDGVPFAAAPTSGWSNVPVLGELTMYALHSLGPVALAVALLLLTAVTLVLLGRAAGRTGAHGLAVASAIALAAAGMLPTFGVVRGQMLSLVPYALLILLLRAESARPSTRIWLVVPLVAVWGNLHGGVLVGVALIGCYLVLARLRVEPLTAVLVGIATLMSLCANPSLLRTAHYYVGVLSNEAARRGTELWARPDLTRVFDLLMVVAAVALGALALFRGRMRFWEICAALGMGAATAMSARHGMWLLLFLIGPAAIGLSRVARSGRLPVVPRGRSLARALAVALTVVALVTVLGRASTLAGPVQTVATIKSLAADRVVLAPEPLAEDLAAAGVTVWLSNPIDAFQQQDQAAYLDVWLGNESGRRAIEASDLVVVPPGSPARRLVAEAGCEPVARAVDVQVLDCRR